MKRNIREMQVILDEEMAAILSRLGELEKINQGVLHCRFCGVPMNLDNIQLIIPNTSGSFDYVCNDPACVQSHLDEGGVV